MPESIEKQIGTLATIKAKSHFVEVGLQMFGADFVPSAYDSALEQGKCGFDGIGMNVSSETDILFGAMVNGFVTMGTNSLAICGPFVGHDYVNVGAYILLDV